MKPDVIKSIIISKNISPFQKRILHIKRIGEKPANAAFAGMIDDRNKQTGKKPARQGSKVFDEGAYIRRT